jgi:hypothetical protein
VEIIHEQGKLLIYFFSTDFSFQDWLHNQKT